MSLYTSHDNQSPCKYSRRSSITRQDRLSSANPLSLDSRLTEFILITGEDYTDSFISLPATYYQIRNTARNNRGLQSDVARRKWWPVFLKVANKEDVMGLPDTVQTAQRRYAWGIRQSQDTNNISADSVDISWCTVPPEDITESVIRMLIRHYDIPFPLMLQPLILHLSETICNTAILFSMMCDILDRPQWFIQPSLSHHRARLAVFRSQVQRILPTTYGVLDSIGALEEKGLNIIFVDLLTTVLPPEAADVVMDMFLLEGIKAIFRYGLALIKLHKQQIKGGIYCTGDEFWGAMMRYKDHSAKLDFEKLHNYAYDLNQHIVSKYIVPSRAELQDAESRMLSLLSENDATAPLVLSTNFSFVEHHCGCMSTGSTVLTSTYAERLTSMLPSHISTSSLVRVFATHTHGWNLHTLYTHLVGLSPCVITVRARDSQAVIGVLVCAPISPPNNQIRGTGEGKIFRLDTEPAGVCYPWVLSTSNSNSSSPISDRELLEPDVSADSATVSQFAMCTVEYMSFGGSAKHATNAIHLSCDLTRCETGHSDTYNNPSLVPVNNTHSGGFEVGDVEVYCTIKSVKERECTYRDIISSRSP
mmetsp:Transcript_2681/g.4027  ORF Transcript_2681/g.4027 Transcript_2681/m.4027 type:complete len:590 (-) Transcript_2681:164-1933(-)